MLRRQAVINHAVRNHQELTLEVLSDPTERAFFQIIEKLGNYLTKLKGDYQKYDRQEYDDYLKYAAERNTIGGYNRSMIEEKYVATLILLKELVKSYQSETFQRVADICYEDFERSSPRALIRNNLEYKSIMTESLVYPKNESEKEKLKDVLHEFRNYLSSNSQGKAQQTILETRRHSCVIISIILDILNKLSSNSVAKVDGRDMVKNVMGFFNAVPEIDDTRNEQRQDEKPQGGEPSWRLSGIEIEL